MTSATRHSPSDAGPVPPPKAALLEIVELMDEAVRWRAVEFQNDEPVSGADALEFFAAWRTKALAALDAYVHAPRGEDA